MPKQKESKGPKRAAPKRKADPVKQTKKPKPEKAAKTKPPKLEKAAKVKQPKSEQSKKGGMKAKIIAVLAVLLLCAGYAALCESVNPEQVLPRTRIVYQSPETEGDSSAVPEEQVLELSGYNRDGVLQTLEEDFHRRYDNRSVTVQAGDSNYIVGVGNSISLDMEAVADQALAPSQAMYLERGISRIRSLFTWRDVKVQPKVENENQLRKNIGDSGLLGLDTTVQTTWEVKKKKLVFHKGKSGECVDEEALVQQISDAVLSGDFQTPIQCAMKKGEVSTVDWKSVEKQVCRKSRNAKLKLDDNRRDYEIVDSVNGISFDQAAAQQALDTAAEGTDAAVKLKYSAPEITTRRLKNKLFKHKLGTYTTAVSGTWNRISNVRLAAEKCDGIILLKGDKFSYNDTLGERTESNGFKTAGAYLNGETVQELGGGICQISSTMYAAVLNANMKIVERHNHTFASSYIGLGMDATVSWGGPDFRWQNDKDYPVKIEASYWNGYATVTIWGTRTDKLSVEMVSETKETIPYPTETREDPSMREGKTRVSQNGSDGYKVQTYRKIYDDGKLISSEKEAYSVYTPHEKIIYKGTKQKKRKVEKPKEPAKTDDTPKTDEKKTEQTDDEKKQND